MDKKYSYRFKKRLFFIFLIGIFSGCMAGVNVGSLTSVYQPLQPTNHEQIEIFFNHMPAKEAQVIARLEIIGNTHEQMKRGIKKEAAKIGADAVVVIAQYQGSSEFYSLGYQESKRFMGSTKTTDYYLVTYQLPHETTVSYTRWLAYAISYTVVETVQRNQIKTLFDFDKENLIEATRRKLYAEKQLEKYKEQPEKKAQFESAIEKAKSEINQLGFDQLNLFDQKAVLFRAAHLAGVQIVDDCPEGEARMRKKKMLLDTASVLSYMS